MGSTAVGRVLVGLVAVAVVWLPEPAQATNFVIGPTNQAGDCAVNAADNANHYVWYNDVHADTAQGLQSTRSDSYDPTDVNTFVDSSWTSTTDMVAWDFDYEGSRCGLTWRSSYTDDTGWLGYTNCESLSGQACQQFYVKFDNDWMGPGTAMQEKWLACHEFGHSLGLLHRASGCMIEEFNGSTGLVAHDIDQHLNWYY